MLHVCRKRRRNADWINGVFVETFGLQKNLVPVALAEFYDLVFDRRTITWSTACDLPRVHRRAMHVLSYDLVGGLNGPGDAAFDVGIVEARCHRRKRLRRVIGAMQDEDGAADKAAVP